jgi:hypothetical protein
MLRAPMSLNMIFSTGPDAATDAIVLLSGGLDSATALAMAKAAGRRCHALSFRYGQRHAVELTAAQAVARALGADSHRIIDIDLRGIGGSALTDDIAVPKGRSEREIGGGIPITYVPARNTIFVAYALAVAEITGAQEIVIGVNVLDSSGYPDAGGRRAGHAGGHGGPRAPHGGAADRDVEGRDHSRRHGAGGGLRPHPVVLRPRPRGGRLRRLRRLPAAPRGLHGGRGHRSDTLRSLSDVRALLEAPATAGPARTFGLRNAAREEKLRTCSASR